MTIADLLTEVESKLKFDGAASAPIDASDDTFVFQVMKYLKLYTSKTYSIYKLRESMYPDIDDQVANLPQYMFQADKVWVAGRALYRWSASQIYQGSDVLPESGIPIAFCDRSDGTVTFNVPLSSDAIEGLVRVNGWSVHPDLEDVIDYTDTLQVGEQFIDELASFIAWKMMEPIASDEVTVGRMKTYASTAAKHVRQRRGANLMLDLVQGNAR